MEDGARTLDCLLHSLLGFRVDCVRNVFKLLEALRVRDIVESFEHDFLHAILANFEHIHEIILIVLKQILEVDDVEVVDKLVSLERNIFFFFPCLHGTRLLAFLMFGKGQSIGLDDQEAILGWYAQVFYRWQDEIVQWNGNLYEWVIWLLQVSRREALRQLVSVQVSKVLSECNATRLVWSKLIFLQLRRSRTIEVELGFTFDLGLLSGQAEHDGFDVRFGTVVEADEYLLLNHHFEDGRVIIWERIEHAETVLQIDSRACFGQLYGRMINVNGSNCDSIWVELLAEEVLQTLKMLFEVLSAQLDVPIADARVHQRRYQESGKALLGHEHLQVASICLLTWQLDELRVEDGRLTFDFHLRGREPGAVQLKLEYVGVVERNDVVCRPVQVIHHHVRVLYVNIVLDFLN